MHKKSRQLRVQGRCFVERSTSCRYRSGHFQRHLRQRRTLSTRTKQLEGSDRSRPRSLLSSKNQRNMSAPGFHPDPRRRHKTHQLDTTVLRCTSRSLGSAYSTSSRRRWTHNRVQPGTPGLLSPCKTRQTRTTCREGKTGAERNRRQRCARRCRRCRCDTAADDCQRHEQDSHDAEAPDERTIDAHYRHPLGPQAAETSRSPGRPRSPGSATLAPYRRDRNPRSRRSGASEPGGFGASRPLGTAAHHPRWS